MDMKSLPDQALLRQLLEYDPATGLLTWKARPQEMFARTGIGNGWNARFAGKRALSTPSGQGYLYGPIGHVPYMAHRIIWKLVHGIEPTVIDHINGDKKDNRLTNLRNVTSALNLGNMPRLRNNTSGHTGVHLCRSTGKWRAELIVDGKNIRLGRFKDIEAAVEARRKAALAHGFHENHGR